MILQSLGTRLHFFLTDEGETGTLTVSRTYHYEVLLFALCRENEEELEKRQFFLNRELRPLMELTGTVLWVYFAVVFVAIHEYIIIHEKQPGIVPRYN